MCSPRFVYFFVSFGLCFSKIYEKMGPRRKITAIPIILPRIVTVKDCEGVIPIINAENTAIASLIPKPEGVI